MIPRVLCYRLVSFTDFLLFLLQYCQWCAYPHLQNLRLTSYNQKNFSLTFLSTFLNLLFCSGAFNRA